MVKHDSWDPIGIKPTHGSQYNDLMSADSLVCKALTHLTQN